MEWKDKGNQRFKEGKYAEAVECYSKALEVDKNNAALYRYMYETLSSKTTFLCLQVCGVHTMTVIACPLHVLCWSSSCCVCA